MGLSNRGFLEEHGSLELFWHSEQVEYTLSGYRGPEANETEKNGRCVERQLWHTHVTHMEMTVHFINKANKALLLAIL